MKTYFVLGSTSCTGCEKLFHHLVLHPDVPNSKWCMLCFGERFGVELMNKQRNHKLDRFDGGYSFAELWEHPIDHFPGLYSKQINELELKDFNLLKNTPDYIEALRD